MQRNSWILTSILIIVAIALVAAAFYGVNDSGTAACFIENGTKSYSLTSPEQCMAARFSCPAGEEYFADMCGCGCQPISNQTEGELVPHYCTMESREAEFCTREYKPVCGWYDPAEVQCITYPCAITVGNQCEACQEENILYYTEGECPTPNGAQA